MESEEQKKAFDERMKIRQAEEDKVEAERVERERQAYLTRTGRTEMKP